MLYRFNEPDYPWIANIGYNLKVFATKSKLTLPTQVALLFTDNQTPGTRKEILKSLGIKKYNRKGYLSGLMSILSINNIIKYEPLKKSYITSFRYIEFLKAIQKQIEDNNLRDLYKEEYFKILQLTSQTVHFILTDS